MEREQIIIASKLGVAAGLKRVSPIWWEFTWIGVVGGKRMKRL